MRKIRLTIASAVIGGAFLVVQANARQAQGQNESQNYKAAEYNDWMNAIRPDEAEEKLKLLTAFMAKYPNSWLLSYVYKDCYSAYEQLGNAPKVMEFAEKRLSFVSPESNPPYREAANREATERLEAVFAWARAYNSVDTDDEKLATKAHQILESGLGMLRAIKRPEYLEEKRFNKELREAECYLRFTEARALLVMKDSKAANDALLAGLKKNPYDPAQSLFPPHPPIGF